MSDRVDKVFDISLIIKGLWGFVEMFSGWFLGFADIAWLNDIVWKYTASEIVEDPGDKVANLLLNTAHGLSFSSQEFIAGYLFWHGAIKIILASAVYKKIHWSYPVMMVFLLLFIAYQVYRFYLTAELYLLAGIFFDSFLVVLVGFEYKKLSKLKM